MYQINGVSLDNDQFGWRLMRSTQALSGVTKRLSNVEVAGRPGVLPGIPSFRGAAMPTFVVRTPGENVETLYALVEQNGGVGTLTLEDDPSRAAAFELASIAAVGLTAMDELVDVTITLRIPSGVWRAVSRTTVTPASLATAVVERDYMPGISAEITDGDIFIAGNFGNMQITDLGSGSWLKTVQTWPNVAGTGLLFVGATGQAFRSTTADPYTPTTDMSAYVDYSGGGGFRMTPFAVGGDPTNRVARLRIVTTNQSGVTIGLRAYNSYTLRNGGVA